MDPAHVPSPLWHCLFRAAPLLADVSRALLLALGVIALAVNGPGATAAPVLASSGPTTTSPSPADEASLLRTLREQADRAQVGTITELATLRTRAAVEALLEAYDVMQTTFMKREIVRALPVFDGVADAEQPALQKLMDVATGAREPELRDAALDGLGACVGHGRDFLRRIVESTADDAVREKAITLHVKNATAEDRPWYRDLYAPRTEDKDQRKKDKPGAKPGAKPDEQAKPKRVVRLNTIRLAAFGAIAGSLTVPELVSATADAYPKIRFAGLEELALRGDKSTEELARKLFEDPGENPTVRVLAARVLAKVVGVKVAPDFVKFATRVDSPVELRRGLAEILTAFDDPNVDRRLIEDLTRGRSDEEKLFGIYVARGLKDERVDKALLRLLNDKEDAVVVAAAKVLGERATAEAAGPLEKLWKKSGKRRDVMRAAMEATASIRSADPTWVDELVALTKSEDPEVRSLALDGLSAAGDRRHLDKLVAALDDPNWSTRLSALEALERLRMKEAISAIILRMAKEDGRMRNEFANTLWRLTGQPFAESAEGWDGWWKGAREGFTILSDADLAKVASGEEEWRLRQTTRVVNEFFGIRIVSHRVIFVVDVSGSMEEGLANDYRGKPGAKRIDVAKSELVKCIEKLDASALFNVVPFSSDAERWVDGSLAACNEKNRADAVAYVEKLRAGGGTNLFAALEIAFGDPDVDTIFVLSDGEPNLGNPSEPLLIREQIRAWNERRHVVVNTIAIGGQFPILEWLAQDARGTHVKFE